MKDRDLRYLFKGIGHIAETAAEKIWDNDMPLSDEKRDPKAENTNTWLSASMIRDLADVLMEATDNEKAVKDEF